jgi:hypothetical protein
MHERHAPDVYRTKKDIAIPILALLKIKHRKAIISVTKMSDLISGRCLRNKRRFLSDKRPSHVFCELKTPDTIPNCETLVNAVRPGDNDSLIGVAGAHVRKTPEKIHVP